MNDQSEDDRAYMNAAFIPGGERFPEIWRQAAQDYRLSIGPRARLGLTYGSGDTDRFDLFLPETPPKGTVVLIHGGYWMAFGRSDWSHLARGAVERGWAFAIPSYSLAPEVRISQITDQITRAVTKIAADHSGPIVVTGHSAGGHLAARLACVGAKVQVKRAVPISPLSDLRPLMRTAMNQTLKLTDEEAVAESPALLPHNAQTDCHVWVGGQERPAFLWQARLLSEHWSCPWTVAPNRHHFDVIDDLADPGSKLMDVLLG